MQLNKSLLIILILTIGLAAPAQAGEATLKHFVSGSYQQLLEKHTGQPVMLVIWATTCSTCMKKMPLLSKLQEDHNDIKIIMLSVDELADTKQVQAALVKHELTGLENWIFADENAQRLRYEIDPQWFGELPRTYFLDSKHQREGISGALSYEDYQSIFYVLAN
ncbi:TlpA family protein disulfide reductase [Nitrosomonas sp.]|uniref:TlpA family protein disulfide reductase n=1 Tax=Nitrosomonas sp. TaxID=42353 RepID=UPI001DD32B45|nr:TlpA disulfide reductase family protein [Nitrosomonas sp.]MBX3617584.1 TlpA family protein disulfide reductase [Nitrosomonas sp.]